MIFRLFASGPCSIGLPPRGPSKTRFLPHFEGYQRLAGRKISLEGFARASQGERGGAEAVVRRLRALFQAAWAASVRSDQIVRLAQILINGNKIRQHLEFPDQGDRRASGA